MAREPDFTRFRDRGRAVRVRAMGLAASFAIFAASPSALADDEIEPTSVRVEQLADDAFARVSRGEFAEALKLYLEANELAPSATIAFDVAWLYDTHLDAPALALEWYRRTMAAPDVTSELVSRARGRINALEAADRAAAIAASAASAAPSPPARDDRNGAGGSPPSWSPLRTWALVAGGSSIVAFGIGTAFAVVAKNKDSEAGHYCDGDRCTDPRALTLTHDATSAASVANVALVTGAVLLATGVTLWLFAPRHARGSLP